MKAFILLPPTFLFLTQGTAHMQLSWPPPLRSKFDPQTPSALIDYNMVAPLLPDGSDYPCKNYQRDAPLHSVTTYTAGLSYNMSVAGGATHDGGSCQISLSYDNGATFRVIRSMVGGCPLKDTYDFTIPSFAPRGNALFAWTWFNKVGNREMYMNCAEVTIAGSSAPPSRIRRGTRRATATSIDTLPQIFKTNIGSKSSCTTIEGEDLVFPDPGTDAEYGAGMTSADTFDTKVCGGNTPDGGARGNVETSEDGMAAMDAAPTSGPPANTTSSVTPTRSAAQNLKLTITTVSANLGMPAAVPTTLQTLIRPSSIPSNDSPVPSPSPSSLPSNTADPAATLAATNAQYTLTPPPPSFTHPSPQHTPTPPPSLATNTTINATSSTSSNPSISCIPNSLHCPTPFSLSLCSSTGDSYLYLSAVAPGTICVSDASGDWIRREG
ncbi:MAG: hypothetical protein M1836_007515 [Candelina mexicana]|nr:MAG: hypothetical protein M1836_007515 [Candelina mexicana]